jgi:biopolymer transport protein ExbD
MSMRRRGRRHHGSAGGGGGHGEDLAITPLLDLFVALIPFLLMSIVLTKIHILDVGISRPVASVTKTENQKLFDLNVKISEKAADIFLNGKILKSVEKNTDEALWASDLRKALVEIKKQNPDEFKIRFEPNGKVSLQTLIVFMDGVRKLKPEDGEIIRKDESGKPVKLQFLFPNVILRGVYT